MAYVIVKTDGKWCGWYVAPPGQTHSYVRNLQDARVFRTREDAQAETCVENETVRDCDTLLLYRVNAMRPEKWTEICLTNLAGGWRWYVVPKGKLTPNEMSIPYATKREAFDAALSVMEG